MRLRDQITSPARTVLLVLLAASALVFVIACSNVANLILARSVRREGELAIRAALGASAGALRRTLLAESLLLCGAGAVLGVLHRAADGGGPGAVRVALLGARARCHRRCQPAVGRRRPGARRGGAAGVRAAAAVRRRATGLGLSNGSVRITAGTNRRLRAFAVTQIAASFVLLAGAGMLLTTLLALQAARTGFDTRNVLALNVPVMSYGRTPEQISGFYQEVMRRIGELPGVERVAVGTLVPWRDAGSSARPRSSRSRATRGRRRGSARADSARSRRVSSPRSASRSSPAATSTPPIAAAPSTS